MALANQPAKAPTANLAEGLSGPAASPTASIMAGDGPIAIPQASLLFDAEFVRSGDDLTLVGHDGQELLIADYFGAGAPDLIAPNHAMLDGQTVTLLAGPQFPGQYAQAGGATQAAEPIGSVETLQGTVTAQRADGTTHQLKVGDPVFESDVVTTGPGSNIGMKLADGTLVTLQESGKLAINEFVYQADGADNSALLNVIQGTFSLFAGQVAPTGDMQIKTPIATMGIRGTSILGVNVDAILGRLSLTQDPDGHVGFIEIFNNQNGNLFTVLRTVFEKITVSESGLLSITPKTPEELGIDQTLTELLHNFYNQVPQQGPDTSPQPQTGSPRFETPNIQEIIFDPAGPQDGTELLLPQELLEQFLESLLQIKEIRDEIILALTESPSAGQVILDDQPEGSGGDTGTIEGGGVIETTLPFDFGSSGPGSVGFAALDGQPVRSPGPDGNPVTADGQPVASGGVQLVYSWDAGSNTLFAMAGNEVIFTIKVVPTTGAVEVKIIGAVDHLEQFGNDDFLSIDVPFTVQAANGQTATGALTVGISDDVPTIGDLAGINEAGPDSGLEPAAALLNQTVEDALNTLPGNPSALNSVLATVQGEVGGPAKAIAVVWDFLDDAYVKDGPDEANINEAFVRLGVAYAEYIQNGGVPLTDVTAKFTTDDGDTGLDPERLQSLHDNLLGNLTTGALNQRFGGEPPQGDPDTLSALETLIEDVNGDLLTRPYYAGNEGEDPSAAREWDIDNGFGPEGVIDEGDLPVGDDPLSISRELLVSWGADDADNDALGGDTGDRTLTFDTEAMPAGLASNGEQITYTLSDDGTVLTASTCNGTVFTVSLNDDGSGSYSFTLVGNLDHPSDGEDQLLLDFGIVATDSDGDDAAGSFSVAVTDDAPVAVGDVAAVSAPESCVPSSNIVILMDRSKSMNKPAGNDEDSRFELAKNATYNLLMAAGIGGVLVVDFANNVDASGWTFASEAKDYISGLQAGGKQTDLDGALLDRLVEEYGGHPPAEKTYIYVISDGGAKHGDNVNFFEEGIWKGLLVAGQVDGVFGYSVGDKGESQLAPVGWDTEINKWWNPWTWYDRPDVTELTDPNQLLDHFHQQIGYTPPTAQGNVLTGEGNIPGHDGVDDFGADGLSHISSIVIDGETYTDPGQGNHSIEIDTDQGGLFTFHFANDPQGGHAAGDWEYVAPSGKTALPYEHIRYTVTDGDGDQSTSDLTIIIDPDRAYQGGEGNDSLEGEPSEADVLIGGEGADKFVLNSFQVEDFIADYNMDEGDVIDLSALLNGVTADNYESFVRIDDQGDGAVDILQVNTGTETTQNFVDVAKLNSDAGVDIIVNDGSTQHVTNPDHIA